MFARLTALVGSGTSLPFDLGEPQQSGWGQWAHYKGTWKADSTPVSIFRISAVNKTDPKLEAARNSCKRLRTLRHPNILNFKDTVEMEEKGENVIYLVTEPVTPLPSVLKTIDLQGQDRDQYIAMGLQQAFSAVSFLNNDAHIIHGNVCMASIAVTPTLDWKLAAFDLATEHKFNEAMTREIPLVYASYMVQPQYKPGEVAKSLWSEVRDGPSWAVDAWGLGCLMQEVYSGSSLARTEDLRNTSCIQESVLPYYQKLLASQPARRLNPAKVVEAGVLKNKMAELVAFLENLALKDAAEKDAFFKRLPNALPSIPTPVAQKKLLPMLASALEFGGAPPIALTTLLKIASSLPEGEFDKTVVPILTKLFASTDRGIRRGLLENIHSFGPSLPNSLVEDQIFKHVETGFGDANPYLRELTLKSMVILGPKMSAKTLNQGLLKHLAKLQVDEEPSIRANTTVLLGNLAPQLGEASCKKVLLNAFTRALKDPFPPARAAALKAILGTAQYHDAVAAAQRVIPMVGPLCVDPVNEVRESALQCLEHFTGVLKENHKAMSEKERAAAAAVAAASGDSHNAGHAGAAGGGGLLTSFGWAVSSLGLPRGADAPASMASPATGQQSIASQAFGSNSAPSTATPPRPTSGAGMTLDRKSPGTTAAPTIDVDEGNGWEDEDDVFEDMGVLAAEEERQARERLSRMNVSSNSTTRPASGAGVRRPIGSSSSSGAAKGKTMKLGATKLSLPDDSEFKDW